jgi:hypothetical protein
VVLGEELLLVLLLDPVTAPLLDVLDDDEGVVLGRVEDSELGLVDESVVAELSEDGLVGTVEQL